MKFYIQKDLNNPEILKIEQRSSADANTVCPADESLVGKAFKIIEETDEFGLTKKKAVLDEEAEAIRLQKKAELEVANEKAKADKEALALSLKAMKDKAKNKEMTLDEAQDALAKILEHLGL